MGLCILLFATVSLMPHAGAAVTGQEILSPSSSEPWESVFIWRPVVIYNGSTFMMWYSGEDNRQVDNIGLATSKDGMSWSRYSHNPVLKTDFYSQWGQWDDGSVAEAWVIQEGGQYKMWYSGQHFNASTGSNNPTYSIGYATSTDGIHWTKYPTNPIFTPGAPGAWDDKLVNNPIVITIGSSYVMYYNAVGEQGVGQTGIATSADGIHWTRKGMMPPIPKGTWDANSNSLASVTVTPGGYLMAYYGRSTQQSTHWEIGFASSTDGTTSTPYPNNPVLAPDIGAIAFDNEGMVDPMVIMVGGNYYVYYNGFSSAVEGLGLAILPTSQFPVPEFTSPELLTIAVMITSATLLLSRRHLNISRL